MPGLHARGDAGLGSKAVLYDFTEMEPAPISVLALPAGAERAPRQRCRSSGRSVVPNAQIAHLARLAFGGSDLPCVLRRHRKRQGLSARRQPVHQRRLERAGDRGAAAARAPGNARREPAGRRERRSGDGLRLRRDRTDAVRASSPPAMARPSRAAAVFIAFVLFWSAFATHGQAGAAAPSHGAAASRREGTRGRRSRRRQDVRERVGARSPYRTDSAAAIVGRRRRRTDLAGAGSRRFPTPACPALAMAPAPATRRGGAGGPRPWTGCGARPRGRASHRLSPASGGRASGGKPRLARRTRRPAEAVRLAADAAFAGCHRGRRRPPTPSPDLPLLLRTCHESPSSTSSPTSLASAARLTAARNRVLRNTYWPARAVDDSHGARRLDRT